MTGEAPGVDTGLRSGRRTEVHSGEDGRLLAAARRSGRPAQRSWVCPWTRSAATSHTGLSPAPRRRARSVRVPALSGSGGLEPDLVLERSVEDGPAGLVPAVRAEVASGVELAEHVPAGVASTPDAQRCRASGSGEAERLDRADLQSQLVPERLADRAGSVGCEVEVSRASPPVGDREHRFGYEQAEHRATWSRAGACGSGGPGPTSAGSDGSATSELRSLHGSLPIATAIGAVGVRQLRFRRQNT
jgi:hypothetical protein